MCDARGCIGWGSVMFISGIFHDGLMPVFIWALLGRGSLLIALDIRGGYVSGKDVWSCVETHFCYFFVNKIKLIFIIT